MIATSSMVSWVKSVGYCRMRNRLIIAVALGFFTLPAAAADVPIPNAAYSAQRVMETGGAQIMTGQVYHDRGRERWEVSMSGMPRVTIMRPDLGKMIMYMPRPRRRRRGSAGTR